MSVIYVFVFVCDRLATKLKRLVGMHRECLGQEQNMRLKMVGLMRERNLYLEKCRAIEQFGERIDWQGTSEEDTEFLANIHGVLYREQDDTGESYESEMEEDPDEF